jgi:TM2 domain-containing membrane protein YozV
MQDREVPPVAETKSSGIAIVLSFFLPGVGQLYAGHIARGLFLMVAVPTVWICTWTFGLAGLGAALSGVATGFGIVAALTPVAAVALWIWGMVDAKRLCELANSGRRTVTDVHGHRAVERRR